MYFTSTMFCYFFLRGMNPAECETHYLAIAGSLDFYGMDRHAVKVSLLFYYDCHKWV